ncbi:MAG: endonuclease/exonuclease/phosphatase family protein [Alistipes sp.]|nr:endonuclease/exonuclease/phosphatase family protein [Alistipes sp.]
MKNIYLSIKGAVLCSAVAAMFLAAGCEKTEYKYVSGDTPLDVEYDNKVSSEKIRLISFNIQNGMWADQRNGYDNFVKWVAEYDPDICCFQEASSIYTDDASASASRNKRYLPYKYQNFVPSTTLDEEPTGWIELAARWGHEYVVLGAHQDNFPVVFTSKFPIECVQKLNGTELSHGGVHVKIKGINLIGLHLWPQKYAKGEATTGTGGNAYRLSEIQTMLSRTINNSEYYTEKRWLMMGDFNSGFTSAVTKEMNANSFSDILVENHNYGGSRIDYIYATDEMLRYVVRSEIIRDGFAHSEQLPGYDGQTWWKYSDHYPLMVDFEIFAEEE